MFSGIELYQNFNRQKPLAKNHFSIGWFISLNIIL